MSGREYRRGRTAAVITGSVVALCLPAVLGLAGAQASTNDRDGDGMPNRWERVHELNPSVANARGDLDHDGLVNLAEYRQGVDPGDEDSDNDGHDDGDEINDGYRSTDVDDADTDNDGTRDGDENADRDRLANEDEDDAGEACRLDDDDRDHDHVDDEDENELGLRAGDSDSDDDGLADGAEDTDEDGESNEDEDDTLADACDGDRDDDGEADEDEHDVLGTIVDFDENGVLTIDSILVSQHLTFVVTEDTEVEIEDTDEDGTTADLVAGVQVAEVELDEDTGALEEIEVYAG